VAGGTFVTVTGANFVTGATFVLDHSAATGVTFVNSTTLTGTTPAHAVGSVQVEVTNPDGQKGHLDHIFTYQPNLAPNPSFESGSGNAVTNWAFGVNTGSASMAVSTSTVHSGSRAVQITVVTPGDINFFTMPEQTAIPVLPNQTYSFTAYLLSAGGAQAGLRAIEWTSSGVFVSDDFPGNGGGTGAWSLVQGSITTKPNTAYVSLRLVHTISAGTFYWDDVAFTKVGP
jgi:hypothetical protein